MISSNLNKIYELKNNIEKEVGLLEDLIVEECVNMLCEAIRQQASLVCENVLTIKLNDDVNNLCYCNNDEIGSIGLKIRYSIYKRENIDLHLNKNGTASIYHIYKEDKVFEEPIIVSSLSLKDYLIYVNNRSNKIIDRLL
ncbi:MAG: hypothetical protein ACRC5M_05030 [Anaeroplasmataceae bacterium]